LVGLSVTTSDGEEIGKVCGLLPTGANDVLVVRGGGGEYLLPMIEDVVKQVDLEAGFVVVDLLRGLEPVAGGSTPKPRPLRRRGGRPATRGIDP
jgi:16S rRNA processing protein RimM